MGDIQTQKLKKEILKIERHNRILIERLKYTHSLIRKTVDKNQLALIIQRVFRNWLFPRKRGIIVIQKYFRKFIYLTNFRTKMLSLYRIQICARLYLIKKLRERENYARVIQYYFREHLENTTFRERTLLKELFKLKTEKYHLSFYNRQLTSKINNSQRYIEEQFECPITMKKIKESKELKLSKVDGRFYEKNAILRWLRTNSVSPFTRENMDPSDLLSVDWLYNILDNTQISLKCPQWYLRTVDFLNIKNNSSPWFEIPYTGIHNCRTKISIITDDKGVGFRFSNYHKYRLESKGYLQLNIFLIKNSKRKLHNQCWLRKKFTYLHDVNYYFSTREILYRNNHIVSDLFWLLNKRTILENGDSDLLFELSFCHN